MTSYSGSVAYLEYVTKTGKPGIDAGTVLNSAFGLGQMNEARQNYASQVIVEEGANPTLTVATDIKRFRNPEDGALYAIKAVMTDGTVKYVNDAANATGAAKIAYVASELQMETVPATDIPTIGPRMRHIPLVAEPRRIAVRYDQITAFQA